MCSVSGSIGCLREGEETGLKCYCDIGIGNGGKKYS